jgi:hypothetical protein
MTTALGFELHTQTEGIGMNHFSNAILGLLFVGVGAGASFLMFYLWGFPFDRSTHKSEAPRPLMLLHRGLGYLYAAIFVYLMIQMVPRLRNYQIELPARTVAHLIIGLVIGFTLLIKIAIVRFFKHLESTLAPFLGTLLLICTNRADRTLRPHCSPRGAGIASGDLSACQCGTRSHSV